MNGETFDAVYSTKLIFKSTNIAYRLRLNLLGGVVHAGKHKIYNKINKYTRYSNEIFAIIIKMCVPA